jgi:hypothetical protein
MSLRDLPAPFTSTSTIGPIIGVVDGSAAAPGEVGEFITALGTFNYTAYPNTSQENITLLNLPPGDWDAEASASFTTAVGAVFFALAQPVPTGASNSMVGFAGDFGPAAGMAADVLDVALIGQTARLSFANPTPLIFVLQVDQATNSSLLAGTMTIRIECRRRR